jgi:hypothetical protein
VTSSNPKRDVACDPYTRDAACDTCHEPVSTGATSLEPFTGSVPAVKHHRERRDDEDYNLMYGWSMSTSWQGHEDEHTSHATDCTRALELWRAACKGTADAFAPALERCIIHLQNYAWNRSGVRAAAV